MMGSRQRREPKMFYLGFNLEERVPAEHPLRKIASRVDFDFVRSLVKPLYGVNGNVSVDPAGVLKLMFLSFYEGLQSERRLMAQLPMRLDWLWFCGYDLDDAVPDHSVLSKARRRWGQGVFAEFFQRVLEQCLEAGLVDGTVVHLDSSMIEGNASKERLRVYLRQVGGRVYEDLDRADDLGLGSTDGAGGGDEGQGVTESSVEGVKSPETRTFTESPSEAVEGPETPDGGGSPKPGQRITPVDPDARLACKYGKTTLGYKDHRAVDDRSGIITATVTTPANVNDETMLSPVIEAHESNTQIAVSAVAADKAYGTGENYRYLHEHGVTACIPHKDKNCHRDSDLGNRQFVYDATTDTFRCPGGQTLKRRQFQKDKNAVTYVAPREVCEGCVHFARCVSSQTRGRRISRNLNDPYLDWADGCLSRTQRKRLMARRKAKVEGSFADAATHHGFKRARWRGRVRVSIQNLLIAAVQNLRKLLRAAFRPHGTCSAQAVLKSTLASFSSMGIAPGANFRPFGPPRRLRSRFSPLRCEYPSPVPIPPTAF